MLREEFFVKRPIRFSRNFLERAVIDISRLAGKQPLSVYIDSAGGKLDWGAFTASGNPYAGLERM
jgi:hypothetical protein